MSPKSSSGKLADAILVLSQCDMEKDGTMVGAISNPPPYIREATQERILEFEHRKELLCKIHDYPFGKLSTEVLEKVYKLIKK